MGNGGTATAAPAGKWNFAQQPPVNGERPESAGSGKMTIRAAIYMLFSNINQADTRPIIFIGHAEPSYSFRTAAVAEDAVEEALRSGKYNGYAPAVGIAPARKAVAKYLSKDLPYELSPDDVFLTAGCTQAIQILVSMLAARPGANILLPRPGFPYYDVLCEMTGLEARYFDLLPNRGWEVDLEAVEAIADENTAAMVIISPGNPSGTVLTYDHLAKVAETARRLGIMVISDEVYNHQAFGSNPFVPMGVFANVVPVLTLGSISKRWVVPGWRLGWIATTDPNGVFKKTKVMMVQDPT